MSQPISGTLLMYFETGTEGILWAVYEDGKEGYDGLNILENGDLLTVFNDSAGKEVLWQGAIQLEYATNKLQSPDNPKRIQQAIDGFWVHGIQEGSSPNEWMSMFKTEKKASLLKPSQP